MLYADDMTLVRKDMNSGRLTFNTWLYCKCNKFLLHCVNSTYRYIVFSATLQKCIFGHEL